MAESNLTFKSGAILALVTAVLVALFSTLLNHERRITVVETNGTQILSILNEIKGDVKEHVKLEMQEKKK